jgi:peptide/nickel transport system substrate-binding protein
MKAGVVRRCALISVLIAAMAGAASASPAGAQPRRGPVVRLPFPRFDGTLTPYTFELGYPLVTLVYDTLFWRDANGIPQPWLARSIGRTDGGRRLTIALQGGVRWQDGRPLTAADVAFTFQFVASHFHPRFTPELADIERVRATGPLTVTFELRHVSLGFEDQPLSDVPILPKHLWQRLTPGQLAPAGLPVGSGPYRLVAEKRSTGYVFEANNAYFKGAPRVQEVRVPIIHEEQRAYDALLQGQVDMLPFSLTGSAAQSLAGAPGIALRSGPLYSGTALLLNLRRPPFENHAARQAVADALDLLQIASNAGPAAAAEQGYIHPLSPWAAGASLQHFDPSAARAAVARLELPVIHVLTADNDPVKLAAGRQVVLDLRRVGARAALTMVSSSALARAIGETGSAPTFDAAIDSTSALASYDPDFLAAVFGSDPRFAPLNFTGYRSRAFDALAQKVASAPDVQTRRAGTGAELQLLARDLPVVPLFFTEGTFAYRPAAYGSWVFVKGTGILDKRSFLAPQGPSNVRSGSSVPVVRAGKGSDSGSGINWVDAVSLVVVSIVLILAGIAVRGRRAAGRR